LLFATYRFLTKLQTQTRHEDKDDVQELQWPKDLEPELEPTLGQIFLAGAGCGLASTYVDPARPTKTETKRDRLLSPADFSRRQ
jgi:hypothetical protein